MGQEHQKGLGHHPHPPIIRIKIHCTSQSKLKESCKWYLSCTKLLKTKIWKLKELGVSQKYENNKPKKETNLEVVF